MNYRHIAALPFTLAALALPSSLCAQNIDLKLDQTLVENFDGTTVPDAFAVFGATFTQKVATNGTPLYEIVFPNKLAAEAEPAMCKDAVAHTGCTGLAIMAVFSLPTGKTPADMAQIVNGFNATHQVSQAVYGTDGKSRLLHYVIADYGITKTNLLIQIYNFRDAAGAYAALLFPAGEGWCSGKAKRKIGWKT